MNNSDAPGRSYNWAPVPWLDSRIDAEYYSREAVESAAWMNRFRAQLHRLGDLCSLITDGTHVTPEYKVSGVPFLSAKNLEPCHIVFNDHKWIDDEAHAQLTRWNCSPVFNDILVAKSGSIGNTAITTTTRPFSVFESVAIVRLKPGIDAAYVCAYLNTPVALAQIRRSQKGAVIPHIHLEDLRELKVLAADRSIQHAIGNKIRKAERLRELAEAAMEQFARWLDEASSSSKLEPRHWEYLGYSPDATCTDGAWIANVDTADRIDPWPHHVAPRVIRRHLRQVAKAHSLADYLSVVSSERENVSSQSLGDGDYHIGVLDVDSSGGIAWDNATSNRYDGSGVVVESGDLLYSCLNPKEARACVLPKNVHGRMIASLEFTVLRPTAPNEAYPYLLAALLRSPWVRVQSSFMTRSSSLSRRRLQEEDLLKVLIPWCDEHVEMLNSRMATATGAGEEAIRLVAQAKTDVEALIAGTLDEERLLAESAEIEAWLQKNPSPYMADNTRNKVQEN